MGAIGGNIDTVNPITSSTTDIVIAFNSLNSPSSLNTAQLGFLKCIENNSHENENNWLCSVLHEDGHTRDIRTSQIVAKFNDVRYFMPRRKITSTGTLSSLRHECIERAKEAQDYLIVAWTFLVGNKAESLGGQDIQKMLQEFLFYEEDEFTGNNATLLATGTTNPFFKVVSKGYGRVSCVLKAVNETDLAVETKKQCELCRTNFQNSLSTALQTRSPEHLRSFLGQNIYRAFEKDLKEVAGRFDASMYDESDWGYVENNEEEYTYRQYVVASRSVYLAVNRELRPTTAFRTLVILGIYSPHINRNVEIQLQKFFEFTEEVKQHAVTLIRNASREPLMNSRTNFMDRVSFAIDSSETIEIDDSISNGDSIGEVIVHIADVARFFSGTTPENPVFLEAYKRMATYYLPEKKVLMLPDSMVRQACLTPAEEYAQAISFKFSVHMTGNEKGEISSSSLSVHRSVIRPAIRLTYEEVDEMLTDPVHEYHIDLNRLLLIAKCLRARREENGGGGCFRPTEAHICVENPLQEFPNIQICVKNRDTDSNLMVSEVMIATNVCAGRLGRDKRIPLLYRSQEARQKVYVSETPRPHFNLAVDSYVQVTSPIRRFHDMLSQIQISEWLCKDQDGRWHRDLSFQCGPERKGYVERTRAVRDAETYWCYEDIRRKGPSFRHEGCIEYVPRIGLGIRLNSSEITIPLPQTTQMPPGTRMTTQFRFIDPRSRTLEFQNLEVLLSM